MRVQSSDKYKSMQFKNRYGWSFLYFSKNGQVLGFLTQSVLARKWDSRTVPLIQPLTYHKIAMQTITSVVITPKYISSIVQ